jgi:hypothetical protein
MNKTEDLFKLIKVMSKSEKGYFKKFVQGFSSVKDNHYLLLFDLLDKPAKPSDKQIEKYFAERKTKVNLRALRRYLYQLLIKSLRLYNEKDNFRFEATNRINEIEILMDKGFEEEAYQLSLDSVEHCTRYELIELKLVFLSYVHLTFGERILWEDLPAKREQARKEIISTNKQLEYITELRHLELSIIYLANSFFPTNDKSKLAEVEALMTHPVLADASALTSLEGILGFHNVWRVYYTLKGNQLSALHHVREIPALIESRNAINKSFIGRYARGLLNETRLTIDTGPPGKAWALLEKLRKIPVETPGDTQWLDFTHTAGLIHFLKTFPTYRNDFTQVAMKIERTTITPDAYNDAYKSGLVFDLATFHFYTGDYNHALDLLSILLNEKSMGSQPVYVHARLLQIVIHYEIGNKLLLPSLLKSTFRYMAKAAIQFEFERIVLRFFTRVLRPSNHVILKDELAWMKAEIVKSSLSEYEKTPLKLFDYVGWLTKKAGG